VPSVCADAEHEVAWTWRQASDDEHTVAVMEDGGKASSNEAWPLDRSML
jgi:hypothetical protein